MEFFESYKINEVLEHKYYQIPQELFENLLYKDLGLESKILYSFLLDRLSLSKKNHWINENGEIYLIFTRVEVQNKLKTIKNSPYSFDNPVRKVDSINLIQTRNKIYTAHACVAMLTGVSLDNVISWSSTAIPVTTFPVPSSTKLSSVSLGIVNTVG